MKPGWVIVGSLSFTLLVVSMLAGCEDKSAAKLAQLEGRVQQLEKRTDSIAPGLGDVMMGVQQHHAKLWYALQGRDWDLAKYELGEISEGLGTAADLFPEFKGIPVRKMIPANTEVPLAALGKAIDRKSIPKSTTAYDGLTAGCNACHQAAQHPFVRLQRPGPGQFSDQVFHP
jgi:hypothetical protein